MSKIVKSAKPVVKSTPVATLVAVTRKVRIRQTVLLKVTAAKLHELIGDQEIGVSRKELNLLITASAGAAALAKAGL